MVARDGEVSARADGPAPRPTGTRIDVGTLAAAAEVNRHYAQRLEAHQRASMHSPQEVRDDQPGERA